MFFDGIIWLALSPNLWKVSQIIMIPKPGKDVNLISSYRPISLLPALSKVFEKILIGRIRPLLTIPDHQ